MDLRAEARAWSQQENSHPTLSPGCVVVFARRMVYPDFGVDTEGPRQIVTGAGVPVSLH
jgi:hypothetical protein